MGKPIVKTYGQTKEILKFNDYKAFTAVIPQSFVPSPDENKMKIAKAGSPFPSNDGECKGILLYDVDVTQGDAPGAIVYEGAINEAVLKEKEITVQAPAKAVLPKITFFEK